MHADITRTWPATGAPPEPLPGGAAAEHRPDGRLRLLLYEDDARAAAAACRVLEDAGYAVQRAGGGAAPDEAFGATPPDLALVFATPAGIDEPGLLRRLAAAGIPFVLTAPAGDPALIQRAVDAGAMACFSRPLDLAHVAPAIAVWVARAAELRRLAEREHVLRGALLASRGVATAVGILMARHGITGEAAFGSLRRQARSQRISVRELATRIVDQQCSTAQAAAQPPAG